jgi:regulator of sigma E protease
MSLDFVIAFVVLLGVLIFVHELGHFAVAKWCGVRVLKFSLGFGPPIGVGRWRLRWRRGHTEYVAAWIPLGGFVKMLGETPGEGDDEIAAAHPDETLGAKPLWQKLAIVFAGPAMNLALPVAVFCVTLALGIERPDARIGSVEAGSPAALAGLEAGDRVGSVAGRPARWWEDVADAIAAHPGATLPLAIERDGESREVVLPVASRPGLDEFGEVREIGWAGVSSLRQRAIVGIPSDDAPAARAGLRSGDVVVALGGRPVADWSEFQRAYAAAGSRGAVALEVERGGPAPSTGATLGAVPERVGLELPALGSVAALGVIPASVLVAQVTPDSPAAKAGLAPGDLLLAVDGDPVGSFASFAETVRTSGGRSLEITLARAGAVQRRAIAPQLMPIDVGFGIEEERYLVGIVSEPTTLPGSTALDRERNPVIAVPRAVGMTVDMTRTFLRGLGKLITGEVSRRQLAGPIGIAQIAGAAWQRGWETYLAVLVLISINLGILNLLPIPILDGGQALLFLVEGVKRQPLSLRSREIFQQIGLTVLVLLMGMAFWNDISRHWSKVVEWLRSAPGL